MKPQGLSERGEALWDALGRGRVLSPAAGVLAGEACRILDRLDRLDLLLTNDVKTWAVLTHRTQTEDYELVIDEALAEARQQAATLRQLVATVEDLARRETREHSNALDAFLAELSTPLRDPAGPQ